MIQVALPVAESYQNLPFGRGLARPEIGMALGLGRA
jgi:hypothetical protein